MRVKGDKHKARRLRRSMSLPEVLLWRELRKKPNGLQYRRQHPAGPYVLDFFRAKASRSKSTAKRIAEATGPNAIMVAINGSAARASQ